MKYKVEIPEVHYAIFTIEAKDEAEAIDLALNGEGGYERLEYSHYDTDSNNYKVEKLEN